MDRLQIMVRYAEDDFDALNIANAMEQVGAIVFSITYRDTVGPTGRAIDPHPRFLVWAKVTSREMIDEVDAAI